jgi:hypothetical protein
MRNSSITYAALIFFATAAQAQQSLFDQKPADPSGGPAATAAPAGAPPAPAQPKPKPRGPHAARALTIVNASTATVTGVEITGESKTVKWDKPIAAQAKAIVKLPRLKACTVSVVAKFEGEGQGNPGEVDICKEKTVRLTD